MSVVEEAQIQQVTEFVHPVGEQVKISSNIITSTKESKEILSEEKIRDVPSQMKINIESRQISTEKQIPLIGKVEETFTYEDEEKDSGDEVFDVPSENVDEVSVQQIQSGNIQISVQSAMVSMIGEAKEKEEEKPKIQALPSVKEITVDKKQLMATSATEKTIDTEAMEAIVSVKKESLSDEEFFDVPLTEVTQTEFQEIKPKETKIAISATAKSFVAEDITPELKDKEKKIAEETEIQPQSDEVLISEMEQIIVPSPMETFVADSKEVSKEMSVIALKPDLELKPKVSDVMPVLAKDLSSISMLTLASESKDIRSVEKVKDFIPETEVKPKTDETITTERLQITVSSGAPSVTKEEMGKMIESTTSEIEPHKKIVPKSEEVHLKLASTAVAATKESIVAISEEHKPDEKVSVVEEAQIQQVTEFVHPVGEQVKISSNIITSTKESKEILSEEKIKDVPSQMKINIESRQISTEKQKPLIGKVEETFTYEDEEKDSGDEVFDVPSENVDEVSVQQIQSGNIQISVQSAMVSMIGEAKEKEEEKPKIQALPSVKEITVDKKQLMATSATEKTIDTEAMEAIVSVKKESLSDEEFFDVPLTEVTQTEFQEIKPKETKIAISATAKSFVAEDITPKLKDREKKIAEETEVQSQSDEVLISEMEQIIVPSPMETFVADSKEVSKEMSVIALKPDLELKPKVSDVMPVLAKDLSSISMLTLASESKDIRSVEKVKDIIPETEVKPKTDETITTERLQITVSSGAPSVTKEEMEKMIESTTSEIEPHKKIVPKSEEVHLKLASTAVAATKESIVAISEEHKPDEKVSVVEEAQIQQVTEFVHPVGEQVKISSNIITSTKESKEILSEEKIRDVPSQMKINIESRQISTEKQKPLIGKVEETFTYEDEEKDSGDEVFDVPSENVDEVSVQQIQSGNIQISVQSAMVSMIGEAKEKEEEKPKIQALPSVKEITVDKKQLMATSATEKTIDTEAMEAIVSVKKESLSDEEFFDVSSNEVTQTEFQEIKPKETKIAISATAKSFVAEDITPELKDKEKKIAEETEVQPQSDEVLISEMEQIIVPSPMETFVADSKEVSKEMSVIALKPDLELKPKVSDVMPVLAKDLSSISMLTLASESKDIRSVEKVKDIIPETEVKPQSDDILISEMEQIVVPCSVETFVPDSKKIVSLQYDAKETVLEPFGMDNVSEIRELFAADEVSSVKADTHSAEFSVVPHDVKFIITEESEISMTEEQLPSPKEGSVEDFHIPDNILSLSSCEYESPTSKTLIKGIEETQTSVAENLIDDKVEEFEKFSPCSDVPFITTVGEDVLIIKTEDSKETLIDSSSDISTEDIVGIQSISTEIAVSQDILSEHETVAVSQVKIHDGMNEIFKEKVSKKLDQKHVKMKDNFPDESYDSEITRTFVEHETQPGVSDVLVENVSTITMPEQNLLHKPSKESDIVEKDSEELPEKISLKHADKKVKDIYTGKDVYDTSVDKSKPLTQMIPEIKEEITQLIPEVLAGHMETEIQQPYAVAKTSKEMQVVENLKKSDTPVEIRFEEDTAASPEVVESTVVLADKSDEIKKKGVKFTEILAFEDESEHLDSIQPTVPCLGHIFVEPKKKLPGPKDVDSLKEDNLGIWKGHIWANCMLMHLLLVLLLECTQASHLCSLIKYMYALTACCKLSC